MQAKVHHRGSSSAPNATTAACESGTRREQCGKQAFETDGMERRHPLTLRCRSLPHHRRSHHRLCLRPRLCPCLSSLLLLTQPRPEPLSTFPLTSHPAFPTLSPSHCTPSPTSTPAPTTPASLPTPVPAPAPVLTPKLTILPAPTPAPVPSPVPTPAPPRKPPPTSTHTPTLLSSFRPSKTFDIPTAPGPSSSSGNTGTQNITTTVILTYDSFGARTPPSSVGGARRSPVRPTTGGGITASSAASASAPTSGATLALQSTRSGRTMPTTRT
ncbi:hypothetical protein BGW80DRAFT_1315405 [Lactifluus volemus]|nr:hypothetical protein BGW80DRAFT_1315405 [Lactifluus volemus]